MGHSTQINDAGHQPSTPVMTKVSRINQKLRQEQEEEGGKFQEIENHIDPKGRRLKILIQPTLSSFLSLRSGLVGPDGNNEPKHLTSRAHIQETNGKGLVARPEEGSHLEFGDRGQRPMVHLEGSP